MTPDRALLAELAQPRLAGSPAHERVRDALKRELAARGFVVMEQRFRAAPHPPLWGPRPAEGINLVAVRPRARVAVWLAAHYDSKGQPLSMAARLGLVAGTGAAVIAAVIAMLLGGGVAWGIPGLVSVALALALSRVTDASPGAVDNATGVLTVLATLDALPADAPVGVIFPDAEELGLQGARAMARARANLLADTAVINVDGIDDRGRAVVLVHRAGPTADAVAAGLGARRWRRLPVLVDGMAFAAAARECVTILKGDWHTMGVVHRPSDTADRLTLAGVREVSRRLAAALAGALTPP